MHVYFSFSSALFHNVRSKNWRLWIIHSSIIHSLYITIELYSTAFEKINMEKIIAVSFFSASRSIRLNTRMITRIFAKLFWGRFFWVTFFYFYFDGTMNVRKNRSKNWHILSQLMRRTHSAVDDMRAVSLLFFCVVFLLSEEWEIWIACYFNKFHAISASIQFTANTNEIHFGKESPSLLFTLINIKIT